jgi:hypothetical protein
MEITKTLFILALSTRALTWASSLQAQTPAGTPTPGWSKSLQASYTKKALPILKQSCFACHGPKPQDTSLIQDPGMRDRAEKTVAKAQKEFPMNAAFPFPVSIYPKADLKDFYDSLRKNLMPPKEQKELGLGNPLGDADRKALLDWAMGGLQEMK